MAGVSPNPTPGRWLAGLLAALCWIGPVVPAQAANEWMLWERPLDVKGQPSGAWRRTRTFESERWCKGAMTSAINEAVRPKDPKEEPKTSLAEYQCLPSGSDPASPKSSR
jgi:hypothetical protein